MNYEKSAGVIVYKYNQDQKSRKEPLYLLLRNTQGHWDFPKGKIEHEETPEQAALRELQEEAGIVVILDGHFKNSVHYIYKDKESKLIDKTVTFYLGELKLETSINVSHEHTCYKWLTLKNAQSQVGYKSFCEILILANIYIAQIG